jgi:hypothetical protein
VIVLNALPIDRPVSNPHRPYKLFTSDNFFTADVEAIATRKKVSAFGMTLDQLARVLGTFPVKVERFYASESNIDEFRRALKDRLQRPDKFILVNYLRKTLGQESGGHISPLAAYNENEDTVLILDTANFKYPWTWVKVEHLWNAMAHTVDSESNRSRGYVTVSLHDEK